MAEKQFNTRIINKHDTAANWGKATNFIPKKGELIVYDADTANTQPRLKIGDGTTTVINLPFITDITNIGETLAALDYNGASASGTATQFITQVTQADGLVSATKASIPTASGTTLGMVKQGGDVTISSGVITVNDDSHNHIISNVDGLQSALDAKATPANITSAIAALDYTSPETDGTALEFITTVSQTDGVVSATKAAIPVASSDTLGLVKSGTDITVDASGNVSVKNNSHNHTIANVTNLQSTLDAKATPAQITSAIAALDASDPTASGTATSFISTISQTDGVISATKASLPTAGTSLGMVKSGGDVTISSGTITVKDDSHSHTTATITGLADGISSAVSSAIGALDAEDPEADGTSTTFISTISETDGIIAATKASIPTANSTTLGMVKAGGDVTISSGVITVKDDSHNHVISNVDGLQDALNAKATPANITSAIAALDYTGATAKGNATSFITQVTQTDGVVSATKASIPIATSSQAGLVKSGTDITVDSSGNVSVNNNSHSHTSANISDLSTTISTAITNAIGALDASDPAASGSATQFITSISQKDGVITATKANITAAALGLSGAMKFLGTSATAITDGATTNPITIGSTSTTVASGNVVLYGSKEFVWNGSAWEELGNEGSYKVQQSAVSSPATSGSTTAFIDTISQNAQGVITATKKNVTFPTLSGGSAAAADATVVGGVTVSGHAVTVGKKTLTAGNNVTITGASDKITIAATDTKYSTMGAATASTAGTSGLVPAPAAGKQGQYLRGDGTWATPTNTTYNNATTSAAGLMSAADKTKLDGIATGANNYSLPTASSSTLGGVKIGTGIGISNGIISNSGVRSISTGTENGTISVNTNGTAANVAVKGLGSAAYKDASGTWEINITGSSGSCTGNAATATILGKSQLTADTVDNVTHAGLLYGTVSSYAGPGFSSNDAMILSMSWNNGNSYGAQIALDDATTPNMYVRNKASSWSPWSKVLLSTNYTDYTVKKDGTGASGDWGINITGNAKTATTATNVAWSGVTSKPSYYDAKAIKSISRNGTTFTATHLDGTTSTFTQQDNNTTYSAATQSAAGLMTAADKAKLDGIASGATANTGDITGVTAGNGLTGGGSSGSVTLNVGAGSGITVAADTVSVNTSYTTSGKNYKVAVDSTSGGLYVNVPWTDTNTTYSAATTSANGLMTSTMVTKLNGIATGATKDTAITTAEINSICV